MATAGTRVLGIDTALRSTGVAVVEAQGNRLRAVEYGALRTAPGRPLSECLRRIAAGIDELIERAAPQCAVVEGGFFQKNARTAMVLGQARGAAIAACARRGLPVFEYAPRRVKQALVGFGGADKEQVRRMVMTLLGLTAEPQEDAGDALALAICHVHSRSRLAALAPVPI